MNTPLTRRYLLGTAAATGSWLMLGGCSSSGVQTRAVPAPDFAALEARAGGRLGIQCLDTSSGRSTGHRINERFGMCSTFKLPLAGVILDEAAAGRLSLDEVLPYTEADMLSYAPVTRRHIAQGGMTIGALAEAAQVTSDNTAANLLLARLGGPEAFTAKLRALGDCVTRLDRLEGMLNLVPPGEVRDTTTPAAMAALVARLFGPDFLPTDRRETLARWTRDTQTGLKRLRAGLPAEWNPGDKTGTAIHETMANKHNDVAIAWPPERGLVVIAAYYDAPGYFDTMRAEDDAVLAEAGRVCADWIRSL